jgi:CubicO group peptidase (beta-lactamase class C family)
VSPIAVLAACVLTVAACVPLGAFQARPAALDQRVALFARYLDGLRLQAGIPGLSAAVVVDRRIFWEQGFGYEDAEGRVAASPNTLYPVASLTKTFASTLLLQCVEAGRLDLNAPMRQYTSSVPDASATVHHVLSMTSDAPAGSMFRYDGDRYSTLTSVVEACAGRPFRVALATQILDRLGMFDSVPGHDLADPPPALASLFAPTTLESYRRALTRIAKPYRSVGRRYAPADYPPRGINAAAGLVSTVRDLARYDAALDDGILVGDQTRQLAWTPSSLRDGRRGPYGLGWFTQSIGGGESIVWHFGLWPSFSSLIVKRPDRGVTLILLANSDGLNARFPMAAGDVRVSPFARAFLSVLD